MTEGRGTPHEPRFIRSYDAPTTPLPRVQPPIVQPAEPPLPPPPPGKKWARIGITVGALVVAVVAVFLFFTAFGGDEPDRNLAKPSQVQSPSAGGASPPSAPPSPSPSPIVLPKPPAARPLTVFPGAGTSVASVVSDRKSGISYAMFSKPWKKASAAPFAYAQKAGNAVIVSSPLPGTAPARLSTYADYRTVAARAARWTLIHRQPPGAKFAWTASQQVRYGMGWLLGYKVSYEENGKRQTARAIVIVMGNGRAKPAMLFASVPSDESALYRDLDMLLWTARPLF